MMVSIGSSLISFPLFDWAIEYESNSCHIDSKVDSELVSDFDMASNGDKEGKKKEDERENQEFRDKFISGMVFLGNG